MPAHQARTHQSPPVPLGEVVPSLGLAGVGEDPRPSWEGEEGVDSHPSLGVGEVGVAPRPSSGVGEEEGVVPHPSWVGEEGVAEEEGRRPSWGEGAVVGEAPLHLGWVEVGVGEGVHLRRRPCQ